MKLNESLGRVIEGYKFSCTKYQKNYGVIGRDCCVQVKNNLGVLKRKNYSDFWHKTPFDFWTIFKI